MSVEIELDLKAKTFHLSAPIYRGPQELPQTISQFFNSFAQGEDGAVSFETKVPFSLESQSTFRKEFYKFARKAKECHKLIRQIAFHEQLRDINAILDL